MDVLLFGGQSQLRSDPRPNRWANVEPETTLPRATGRLLPSVLVLSITVSFGCFSA